MALKCFNSFLNSRTNIYALSTYSFQNFPSTLFRPNFFRRELCLARPTCCSVKQNTNTASHSNEDELPSQNEEVEHTQLEKELLEKTKTLSEEVNSLKDKYQRSLADKENLRKRLEKQIQDSKLYGIQSFCKDLLEVSDVFRKAIESVPSDHTKQGDLVFNSLYDGVVMTETQLLSVFKRHGLKPIIVSEGEKFDPSTQEAMFEVPAADGKEPGGVAHVLRNGWMLHDRCIRSAQVGVIKK